MSIRIKDVARYAGVSPATVSRALNDHPHVTAEIRRRVHDAVKALGYRPNYIARSMRVQSTRLLGFLERDARNPNFSVILPSAEEMAGALGYSLLLSNSSGDPAREHNYIQLLLRHQVDGLVIFVADEHTNNVNPLIDAGVPFVLADSDLVGVQADAVVTEGEPGIYLATQHLLALGHRSIGLLVGHQTILPARARYRGFVRALEEVGQEPDLRFVRFCELAEDVAKREMLYLLSLDGERPTAMIASSNQIMTGCLAALAERGLRLPDDLSFVGFDNTPIAGLYSPPLTVVARPLEQLGEETVRLLVKRINGELPPEPQRIVLSSSLLVRGSTAPPR